jgi:hypothetical protein
MDWLTFISKVIEAIAWPAVVVAVLLYLRKELPNIVKSLRKLKFKDVELEFGEAAIALAAETKRVVPAAKTGITIQGQDEETVVAKLSTIAELSPRAAILEAWLLVEGAAADLLRNQQSMTTLSANPGPMRIREGLRRAEVLTPPQEAAFEHLRRLRNEAVHAPDAEFTAAAVASYVQSAVAMAVYLEDIASRLQ